MFSRFFLGFSKRPRKRRTGPGSKKCPKQSRNSLRRLKIDCFETPETVSRLFRTLFGLQGREAPGDSFETLSGFRARRARETPVRGGRGCMLRSVLSAFCGIMRPRLLCSCLKGTTSVCMRGQRSEAPSMETRRSLLPLSLSILS